MKSLSSITFILLIIFAIAGGCGGSKKIPATTEWRAQSVVVDGKTDDWQLPLRYANAATGLNYSISNDDKKLYFCFTTIERRPLAKITMGGLQIQVAASGADPAIMTYPIPGTIQPEKGSSKNKQQQQSQNKKEFQLSEEATSLQVSGFPFAKATTELPLANKYGVNVGTEFGKDRFSYEASIPLEGLNLEGKEISITIVLKGIPKDQMKTSYNGMQQGNRTGPGGMRTGGGGYGMPGGGYSGGGNSGYAQMFTDQKITIVTHLASAQ
ncbi:MAG: hypothetical protein WDO14_24710 [Bacteroidota bacterium]